MLDRLRLGKQRSEVKQILTALEGESKGWRNHPATLMWKSHENALRAYGDYILAEWVNRGYNNNMPPFLAGNGPREIVLTDMSQVELPSWFGDEAFHRSHRSNLLRKDYEYYSKHFNEPTDLEYIWPTKK